MNNSQRIAIMQERLEKYFSPEFLEIIDDSHKHVGHAGSKDGAGHFTVKIKSSYFANKSRIESHREIYRVLDDLIPGEVHALRIVLS